MNENKNLEELMKALNSENKEKCCCKKEDNDFFKTDSNFSWVCFVLCMMFMTDNSKYYKGKAEAYKEILDVFLSEEDD